MHLNQVGISRRCVLWPWPLNRWHSQRNHYQCHLLVITCDQYQWHTQDFIMEGFSKNRAASLQRPKTEMGFLERGSEPLPPVIGVWRSAVSSRSEVPGHPIVFLYFNCTGWRLPSHSIYGLSALRSYRPMQCNVEKALLCFWEPHGIATVTVLGQLSLSSFPGR